MAAFYDNGFRDKSGGETAGEVFMQISVESKEGLERRMTVELPAEMISKAVERRLKEVSRTANLNGFRPGKVPMSVVRKKFTEQVRQEIFGDLVQSSYFEALTQEKLEPAGQPSIEPHEDVAEGAMGYTAVFEVMPEVKLNDLSAAVVNRPVAEVGDADIEAMIEKLRSQKITWNDVERESQDGDQVTINFKGFIDGEAFEGGAADGVPLVLGSSSMIDGFEAGLLGAKAGEDRTLELTFPEDYQAEHLAGKAATFETEVTKVAEPVMPELDEEFAKSFGTEEGGVEAMKADIRANMERELSERIKGLEKEQVMDALLEANPIDVPQALIQQESQALLQQTKANMQQSGQGSNNIDLPLSLFEDQAKKRVCLGLLIAEVIKENDIKLDEERVRAKVEQFASTYEKPQEVIDHYYGDKQQLAAVENVVIEEQVVDWILAQVKVEDSASTFDAIMNPQPEAAAEDA
ncbi:MAG: trigger factor [Candidatus Sedimenticola sp. (ex Thyasira tokunagai)]